MFKSKKNKCILAIIVAVVTALIVAIKIDEKKTGETIMQSYERYILDHHKH